MKALVRLLVVVLMVGGWVLAALTLHVIRTNRSPRQFIVIPKNQIHYKDTYVDTRAWTIDDVARHPAIVQRLIDTGKHQALSHTTGEDDPWRVLEELTDALQRGSATTTESSALPPPSASQ